ncbi:thioredoxin domain-containing protein [Patescibacteria group bacterium]
MAEEGNKSSSGSKLAPFLVVLSIGLAFTVGFMWQKIRGLEGGTTPTATQNPQANPTPIAVDANKVDQTNEPFVGNEDAPLTMIYWSDYQCPFCKQVEEDAVAALYDKYVKTGKLKIVFKDFQFLGEDSTTAALAESAVWELYPTKFYAWQQKMMEMQDAENSGWGKKSDIMAIVASLGMDSTKVSNLMDEKKDEYMKEMDEDKQEGASLGITGTPGFIVGTQAIYGAEPQASFESIIETQLK